MTWSDDTGSSSAPSRIDRGTHIESSPSRCSASTTGADSRPCRSPSAAYSSAIAATALARDGRSGLLFAGIPAVTRRARTGGAHEQPLAVREGDVAPVGAVGTVLRLVAVDQDLGPLGQRLARQPAAEQRVRRPALDHPAGSAAVGFLDVNVNP